MNTPRPDVSILIAAYNAADTIRAAIDSALEQRGVNVEIVVCDDGSADNTIIVATELYGYTPGIGHKNIVIKQHERNYGQSAALNTCMQQATGRYFMQLDADDTFAPDCLQRLVNYLDTHLDTGFVCGSSWVKSSIPDLPSYIYIPPIDLRREHFYERNASFYCVLFRREAYDLGARYADLGAGMEGMLQDWDMLLQLTEIYGMQPACLPDVLALEYTLKPHTLYWRMKERENEVLKAFKSKWGMVTTEAI